MKAAFCILFVLIWTSSGLRAAGADLLWQDVFDGQIVDVDAAQGRVLVAGRARERNGDFFVRAYDARSGSVLWEDRFDGNGGSDVALRISESNGLVSVAGSADHDRGSDSSEFLVRSYNARTGVLLWNAAFGNGHLNSATNVVATSDRIIATGFSEPETGELYSVVRAYDARSGDLVWESRIGKEPSQARNRLRPPPSTPVPLSVMGGRVFVGGATVGGNGVNGIVRAHDADTGQPLWERHLDRGPGGEVVSALSAAAGRVFAVGRGSSERLLNTILVRAYNAIDGAILWQTEFEDPRGHAGAVGTTIFANAVFIAGRLCTPSGDCGLLVLAYDAGTGALLWEDDLVPGFSVIPLGTAAGMNRLFVVGGTQSSPGRLEYFVRAYEPRTGRLLWVDQSQASQIAVAVDVGSGLVLVGIDDLEEAENPRVKLKAYDAK